MIHYKYGKFHKNQIGKIKERLRKQIYFLLLIADPATAENYDVNVIECSKNVQHFLGGYNSLTGYQKEVVIIASLLEEALINYIEHFDFAVYRKLILDAGQEVLNIKEVDNAEP